MFNQKLKAQLQACQTRLDEEQGIIEAIKAGAATVIFSPEGIIQEASTLPGPDGIWCRRTDWAAPQPALSEGLGSPVTIASSGGVSAQGRCSQAPSSA